MTTNIEHAYMYIANCSVSFNSLKYTIMCLEIVSYLIAKYILPKISIKYHIYLCNDVIVLLHMLIILVPPASPQSNHQTYYILSAKRKYNAKLVNIFASSQYSRLKFSPLSLNIAIYQIL